MKNSIKFLLSIYILILSPTFEFGFLSAQSNSFSREVKKIDRLIGKNKKGEALVKINELIQKYPKSCSLKKKRFQFYKDNFTLDVPIEFIVDMYKNCKGYFISNFNSIDEISGTYKLEHLELEGSPRKRPSNYSRITKNGDFYQDHYVWFENIPPNKIEQRGKSFNVKFKEFNKFYKLPNNDSILIWYLNPCIMSPCGYIAIYKKNKRKENREISNNSKSDITGVWQSSLDGLPSKIDFVDGKLIWFKNRGPSVELQKKDNNIYTAKGRHLDKKYEFTLTFSSNNELTVKQNLMKTYSIQTDRIKYKKVEKIEEKIRETVWIKGLPFIKTLEGCSIGLFNWVIESNTPQKIYASWSGNCDSDGIAQGEGVITYYENNLKIAKYEGKLVNGIANGYGCFDSDCGTWKNGLSPRVKEMGEQWDIMKESIIEAFSGGSETNSSKSYSLGDWKTINPLFDSSVHDNEKISIEFNCNGIQWKEYIGRDLSKPLPFSAGTNVCDGIIGNKRFSNLDEAVQKAIDCRCN